MKEQDIYKIITTYTNRIEEKGYSKDVQIDDLIYDENTKQYTLNIPRYIESNEKEDVQDIDAHLYGDVNDKGLIRCISKSFIVKSLDWQYEEEVRCILFPNSEGVSKLEELSLYTMPTNITKIYVGCKVDKNSEEYKELLQLAKAKEIGVIELIESEDLFSLEAKGGGFND